ncbi:hypothetical protein [Cohnella abietis]|uniref:VRR-NUC domain-containing protein n=1 Tax=Cohnella abietis TaxID=2507935 RepID=A0A3T1D1C2_9BACL|nr:hypothetical protein [Cohnella abietis]BBI31903.1 hypothetical protein KCTCHS21_13020 [Cohnella abietis]
MDGEAQILEYDEVKMMGFSVSIPTIVIPFKAQEEHDWVRGIRDNCSDEYLRKLVDRNRNFSISGFGEHIAGKFYESLGYRYLHRYGIFGGNRIGTFPEGDEVLKRRFGEDFFLKSRTLYPSFSKVKFELPDLLIYNEDCSYIKFVEAKRSFTNDKIREPQARGLTLLATLLDCEVEVAEVCEETRLYEAEFNTFEF